MGACSSANARSSSSRKSDKNKKNSQFDSAVTKLDPTKADDVFFVTGKPGKKGSRTSPHVYGNSNENLKDGAQDTNPAGDASTVAGSTLSQVDARLGTGRSSTNRASTLSVRSITEEVRGSLTRNGSLQELLVSLHEEESNIRSLYAGIDADGRSSVLGKGNWGTVKIVTRKRDNQKFACKELVLSEKMPNSQFEELKSEIESLSRLDHPHIARLYEAFEEPGKRLYLVMELLTGGELYTRLVEEAPDGRFTEKRSKILSKRMCSALSYLHGQGIVHRDLKLENFVFRDRDPESDRIVLIDFGLARRFSVGTSVRIMNNNRISLSDDQTISTIGNNEPTIIMNSIVGSSYYIAPEVLDGHYSGPLCDIWSMGVIVYMMLCGKAPFNGKTEASIMKKAQIGEYSITGAIWDSISKDAKDFVSRCLTKDVSKRITAAQALNHPWILSLNGSALSRRKGELKKEYKLPSELIENMVTFAEWPEFVRIGCQAAAFSFSRGEVADYSSWFDVLDSDGDGYITEKDIRVSLHYSLDGNEDFLNEYKENMDKEKAIDALSKKIFSGMDTEHFGMVRFTYFVCSVVPTAKYYTDMAILREAFHKLDFGRKGYIDFTDLERLKFSTSKAKEIINDFLGVEKDAERMKTQPNGVNHPCIEFRDFLMTMRRMASGSEDDDDTQKKRSMFKRNT